MSDKHKVLLIEDDADYAKLVVTVLVRSRPAYLNGRRFEVVCADRLSTGLERLAEGGIDIVLLDLTLPDSRGLDTFIKVHRSAPELPVVVLSCIEDDAIVARAVQEGAEDYLLKSHTHRSVLVRAVWHALGRHRLQSRRKKAGETRFRGIIENTADGIVIVSRDGIVRFANPAAGTMFGRKRNELVGEMFGFPVVAGEATELDIIRRGGEALVAEMRVTETVWRDESVYLASLRDVTERERAEQALRKAAQEWRTTFDAISDAVRLVDAENRVLRCNKAMTRLLGKPFNEIINRHCYELVHGATEPISGCVFTRMKDTRRRESATIQMGERWFEAIVDPLLDDAGNVTGAVHILADITQRKRAEEALRQKEEQLRQSQKMEAVGRLAGGIAHDFNNLLTVITGYSELVLQRLDEQDPLHRDVEGILKAGERASSLTSQLLAFSRRQVLQPQVLDLNAVVRDMEKMLRRLIGEDIALVTVVDPGLTRIKADRSQIEQVIMNLAVNARDAMPDGGKLTIETTDMYLDREYAQQHAAVTPGHYVMLAVTDSGCGMDDETRKRIFEPFFTTKKVGEGTGLGLSTVYGIVKQSGGNIWVYSEPGQGTTFKVYLPRVTGEVEPEEAKAGPEKSLQGTETVLLVEDEEVVRELARRILTLYGYRVLEAANGGEALLICENRKEPIHFLLTDVVMPGMSGRELHERLAQLRPGMKSLYMSGYPDTAILHRRALEPGMAFIQKPFSPEALARKVRAVLDAPPKEKQ